MIDKWTRSFYYRAIRRRAETGARCGSRAMAADLHFIWLGEHFPWVHWLALASASRNAAVDRLIVYHTDTVTSEWWPLALDLPRVEARRLDAEGAIEAIGSTGGSLIDLFRLLRQAPARSNVLRAALLYVHGGIYLDFDTVTIGSVAPLLDGVGVFCGTERLAFPAGPDPSWTAQRSAAAWVRTVTRDLMRRAPRGWLLFRHLEALYPTAVNNAVLGCQARHPLLAGLLQHMVSLPAGTRQNRYALGTHSLQQVVRAYQGTDLVVHPPEVFYPLGPEISEHWFRRTRA